jgi:two-component system cell cycle response regulator CtrA
MEGQMRILLVEDDPMTSKSIEMMLSNANLNVYATDMGEEGLDLAKLYDYDLILLDLALPDMNGHEVLRRLRMARVDTPTLILSGSDDTASKIKGFGFGADDYLTKPFHREELIARIHAIIRRSRGHAESVIRTGMVTVNLDAKTVEANGQPVHLTGKEYQMLELLSLRKGTTLTKEMFLNHLYGGMDEPELKIIDVFICKLRKKLAEATGGDTYIETVWGRGYVLRDPEAMRQDWWSGGEEGRGRRRAVIPNDCWYNALISWTRPMRQHRARACVVRRHAFGVTAGRAGKSGSMRCAPNLSRPTGKIAGPCVEAWHQADHRHLP